MTYFHLHSVTRRYILTQTCTIALIAGMVTANASAQQQAMPDLGIKSRTSDEEVFAPKPLNPTLVKIPEVSPPGNTNSAVSEQAPVGMQKSNDALAIPAPAPAIAQPNSSATRANTANKKAPAKNQKVLQPEQDTTLHPSAAKPTELDIQRPANGMPGGRAIQGPEPRPAKKKTYYNGKDLHDRYKYRPAPSPTLAYQHDVQNLHAPEIQFEDEYVRLFFDAVAADNINTMRALYNYFKTAELRDEHMNTPLIYATMIGKRRMVEALLGMGANANSFNTYRVTALMIAVKEGRHDIASLLLHYGALPDAADLHGHTAAMYATVAGQPESIMLLAKYGADLNAERFSDKSTALHLAVHHHHKEAAYMLLRNGADPDSSNSHRITPLMLTANYNYVTMAQLLLKFLPDPDAVNRNGETAENVAWKQNHLGLAKMLSNYREIALERKREGKRTRIASLAPKNLVIKPARTSKPKRRTRREFARVMPTTIPKPAISQSAVSTTSSPKNPAIVTTTKAVTATSKPADVSTVTTQVIATPKPVPLSPVPTASTTTPIQQVTPNTLFPERVAEPSDSSSISEASFNDYIEDSDIQAAFDIRDAKSFVDREEEEEEPAVIKIVKEKPELQAPDPQTILNLDKASLETSPLDDVFKNVELFNNPPSLSELPTEFKEERNVAPTDDMSEAFAINPPDPSNVPGRINDTENSLEDPELIEMRKALQSIEDDLSNLEMPDLDDVSTIDMPPEPDTELQESDELLDFYDSVKP